MKFVKTIIALSLAILAIAAPQDDGGDDDLNRTYILYLNACSCTSLTNLTQLVTRWMTLVHLFTILKVYMWGAASGMREGNRLLRSSY
jgi:hypothetical protein